jgi:hypothetical protein
VARHMPIQEPNRCPLFAHWCRLFRALAQPCVIDLGEQIVPESFPATRQRFL